MSARSGIFVLEFPMTSNFIFYGVAALFLAMSLPTLFHLGWVRMDSFHRRGLLVET